MAVFLRKLLRIGKLPDEIRDELEGEGIIHLAEYVPVTRRFSGRIPGKRSSGNIASYVGSFVLTNQRVLGMLSSVPGKAGRAVDHPWNAAQTGAVHSSLSEAGLMLEIPDLAQVHPDFSGQWSLNYKAALPLDALSRVPTRFFVFDVPPKFVYSSLGIPRS